MSTRHKGSILVVDDDIAVRDVVRRYLEREGYEVILAGDGETALDLLDPEPDLVVLDLMLPGLDGLDVCGKLRQRSTVAVVMLTALGEESDRVLGLELGADDYLVKPFSPRELTLRVESVLRRARAAPEQVAGDVPADGSLRLDPLARRGRLDGKELPLTVREFDLLLFLMRHPGRAFSRPELLERVWGWNFGDQSTVTVHMRRLREKVEPDPAHPRRISTVWGVGYRFDPLE